MHALELWWQVTPLLHQSGFSVSWMDLTAFVGVGGVWAAAFLTRLKAHFTLPENDPSMEEALVHGH